MMNDIDIKNKRILLFDFDGTLIETASGNTFATDLTDMRIKMDVVNKALDLMQENGVKVFAIVSNQGGVKTRMLFISRIRMKMMLRKLLTKCVT
jgi:histidinol phosphatase-like enzyme